MDLREFKNKQKYSEASGSIALIDNNFKMEINDIGLYEETPLNEDVATISNEALEVSPNFNKDINESIISEKLYKSFDGMNYDKRMGYYLSTYVGHVAEGSYRENASSGGFGTWIFSELFNKGLIDGVIHVKKSEKDDLLFEYGISRTEEEIINGAKTRYYPVEFSKVLKEVKETPGTYAFIGIPSFVYSLRLLQEKDEILKERVPYTIGIICGHQKSANFAESMAWQMGIEPGNLKDIDFRVKLEGLPSNKYGISVTGLVDGEIKTITKPNYELFGQNWGHGYFKPIASDFTDDVFNETADIVLGDAWLDDYTKETLGNNIIIVRNPIINNLLKNAQEENRVSLDEVSKNIVFKSQSSHYKHTHDELRYRLFKEKNNGEWVPTKRVDPTDKFIDNSRKKIQDLRQAISKESHESYVKARELNDFNYYVNHVQKLVDKYNDAYKEMRKQSNTLSSKIKRAIEKYIIKK